MARLAERRLPILRWLPNYQRNWLAADAVARRGLRRRRRLSRRCGMPSMRSGSRRPGEDAILLALILGGVEQAALAQPAEAFESIET